MATGQWGTAFDRHPLQVKISWLQGTHTIQTGFYLRAAGANVANAQEAADSVWIWVNTHFRTLLTPQNRMVGVDVVDLVDRSGGVVSPANVYGTAVTSEEVRVPSFMAATVSLKSALRTRYGQGRMYFPVMGEAAISGDVLSVAAQTSYQAVITELATRFIGNTASGYNMINVHGQLEPRPATPTRPARLPIPPTWYDVASVRLNIALTALRSRKAGVGS